MRGRRLPRPDLAAAPYAALLVALLLFASRPASGQADMTDEQRLQEAVRLSNLGQLHYDGGEFAEAAENFAAAWDLHPDSILGYNAARSYENSGDPEQALRFYEATLDLVGPEPADEELAQRCRDGRTRIQNLLARVEAERQAQPATLQVRSEPAGAAIFIDGEQQGATPADLSLAAGSYTVRVALDGYDPHEEPVDLEPAQSLVLSVALVEQPPLVTEDEGPNWLAVGLVGGGGVLFVTLAALAAVEANNKFDDAQSPDVQRDDDAFDRAVSRGEELRNGSNFFYGLGFLAIGTAAVLYFVTDDSGQPIEEAGDAELLLDVSPGGAAAALRVGF